MCIINLLQRMQCTVHISIVVCVCVFVCVCMCVCVRRWVCSRVILELVLPLF